MKKNELNEMPEKKDQIYNLRWEEDLKFPSTPIIRSLSKLENSVIIGSKCY